MEEKKEKRISTITTTITITTTGDSKSKRMAETSDDLGLLFAYNIYLVPQDASIKHPTPPQKTKTAEM